MSDNLIRDLVKEMYELISIIYDLSKSDKELAFDFLESLKPFRKIVNEVALKGFKEGGNRIFEHQ